MPMLNSYTLQFMEITGLCKSEGVFQLEITLQNDCTALVRHIVISESLYQFFSHRMNSSRETARFRLSNTFRIAEEKSHWVGTLSVVHCDTIQRFHFSCDEFFVKTIQSVRLEKIPTTDFAVPPLALEETVNLPSQMNKKKTRLTHFRGLRVAVVSLFVLILSVFGVNATMVSAPEEVKEVESEVLYGTTLFPSVEENERAFLDRIDPALNQDPVALLIQNYVPPVPKERFPTVVLTSVRSRTIGPDEIALTFDDGPSRFTSSIVEVLNQYNVGGTFFFVGDCILENESLVQLIHQNGFSMGNHSFGHPAFATLNKERQMEEITATNQLIERITGEKVTLFRPPYGSTNKATLSIVVESGMKIVLWNKDTEDWKVKNAQELVQYAKQHVAGGSIVLFHEKQITVEALPEIIEFIQSKGLKIVVLK